MKRDNCNHECESCDLTDVCETYVELVGAGALESTPELLTEEVK